MTFNADLDVRGRSVVVCGGGPAAYGVISSLLEAGAILTVIDEEPGTTVADLGARGLITLHRHAVSKADLLGRSLVVPAGGDPAVDRMVADLADQVGVVSTAVQSDPAPAAVDRAGEVILVGGGPGDPGLLTGAGLEAVKRADVIVVDRLAPLAALDQARPGTEIIDVAKIPRGEFTAQERINEILVEQARAGRTVVRLKGGDSFVFGRGGEEWQACAAAGLAVRVIPGVSSAIAAPALAGIPLTHRQLTQGFTVVSGHLPPGYSGSTVNWAALAQSNTTLVIMMGMAALAQITEELIRSGLAPTTPAATVANAGMASQQTVRGTVADIARLTAAAGIQPPAITVVGAVAGLDLSDPHPPDPLNI